MINFANQDLEFELAQKPLVKKWIKAIVEAEGKKADEVAYIFCSDNYLLELNINYLKHKTLTDIITFDYCVDEKISGDIFISIERVEENATKYSKTFEEELGRVMAHGLLHLLGYKDKSPEQARLMREKEDQYLPLFPCLK